MDRVRQEVESMIPKALFERSGNVSHAEALFRDVESWVPSGNLSAVEWHPKFPTLVALADEGIRRKLMLYDTDRKIGVLHQVCLYCVKKYRLD